MTRPATRLQKRKNLDAEHDTRRTHRTHRLGHAKAHHRRIRKWRTVKRSKPRGAQRHRVLLPRDKPRGAERVGTRQRHGPQNRVVDHDWRRQRVNASLPKGHRLTRDGDRKKQTVEGKVESPVGRRGPIGADIRRHEVHRGRRRDRVVRLALVASQGQRRDGERQLSE